MKNPHKNTLLSMILLFLSFSCISSIFVDSSTNNYVFVDQVNANTAPLETQPPEQISTPIEENVPISSAIQLQNAGESFIDPVIISMINGTGDIVKQGTIMAELNETYPNLYFKFELIISSPIAITLNSSVDTATYQVMFDLYSGPSWEFFIKTAQNNKFPIRMDYFAELGTYYIGVSGFDFANYQLDNGEEIPFVLTVTQFKKGSAVEGKEITLYQSLAFEQIESIFDFFKENNQPFNYLNEDTGIVDLAPTPLGGINPTQNGYYKAVGSSIYGLVRAGDLIAKAGEKNPGERDMILAHYLNISYQLFLIANQSVMFTTLGAPIYGNPTTNHSTLLDNAYMLLALGEMIYQGRGGPTTSVAGSFTKNNITDFTNLAIWAYRLANSTIKVFENVSLGAGYFMEEAFSVTSSIINSNRIYLESISVLAEALSYLHLTFNGSTPPAPYFPMDYNAKIAAIKNVINTLLIRFTVTDINIDPVGIGVEYWQVGVGKSNTSTLIGNLVYAHFMIISSLDFTNSFTQNILRVFTSDQTGLLFSKVATANANFYSLPQEDSTYENSQFIYLAQRLALRWEDAKNDDIARSWDRKTHLMFDLIVDYLYDDTEGAFFGLYDEQAQKLISDDRFVETHRFVANAFMLSVLARGFPAQVRVFTPIEAKVGSQTDIDLEFEKIALSDALNWYDILYDFKFWVTIEITDFNYCEYRQVDIATFGSARLFEAFVFTPKVRGTYTVDITFTVENTILFYQEISLTAYGEVKALFDPADLEFSTSDSTFSPTITMIDETGVEVSNLQVNMSLGKHFESVTSNKYLFNTRSDSAGAISATFNTRDLVSDGIIDKNLLIGLSPEEVPEMLQIDLFLNATSAYTMNLIQAESVIKLPVRVRIAKYFADFDPMEFSTDDAQFSTVITIIKEGVAIPNLQVEASLGYNITYSKQEFGNKYISHDMTDSSGKVTFTFNVNDFEQDHINRTTLTDPETIFRIYINVTNPSTYNYAGIISVPVMVRMASISVSVSPTNLEIIQSTTDSFSFSIATYNQDQEPIANAVVSYKIGNSKNSVLTDVDGEATISLSSTVLLYLQPPSVPIFFNVTHADYPKRSFIKDLRVRPNSLRIFANPVQFEIYKAPVLTQEITVMTVEVNVEDLFGQSVSANVSLDWKGSNPGVDIASYGVHLSPYTFTIDVTSAKEGVYTFAIIATRSGLTIPGSPEMVLRSISIIPASYGQELTTGAVIAGTFVGYQGLNFGVGKLKDYLSKKEE